MKKWHKITILALCFVLAVTASVFVTYRLTTKRFVRALAESASAAAQSKAEQGTAAQSSNLPLIGSISDDTETIRKIREIQGYLDTYFIDEYDPSELADAAAAGMVEGTGDRWSYYLSAEESAEYAETLENAYVGVGVTIQLDEEAEGLRVMSVSKNGPAAAAGVQVDDILKKAEGQSVYEIGLDETVALVKGPEGTSVHLEFERNGVPYELDLVRSSIQTDVAELEMLTDDVAHVTIVNFDTRCAEETIACVEKAIRCGAKGIVFDVRFNPGGMKDELVRLLDYLLPQGDLFHSRYYDGKEETDTSGRGCVELPMAVLINEDSYSAAEFFAAALQEYEWATVVGMQTCGKGNMQIPFDLSDGSCLNLSIAKYFTPNGRSLTDIGVEPDVVVELDEEDLMDLYYGNLAPEDDEQLQAALQEVQQKIS